MYSYWKHFLSKKCELPYFVEQELNHVGWTGYFSSLTPTPFVFYKEIIVSSTELYKNYPNHHYFFINRLRLTFHFSSVQTSLKLVSFGNVR